MEQVSGVIDSIYTKTIATRSGRDGTVYHAMIGGQDINLGWKTQLQQGQTVNLNVEHKYGGLQLIQGGAQSPAPNGVVQPANNTAAPRAPSTQFPTNQGTKDVSIIRQNSMTHATRMVDDMVQSGTIGKLNEDDYIEKVIEVAYRVADFSTGWREKKMADAKLAYTGDNE